MHMDTFECNLFKFVMRRFCEDDHIGVKCGRKYEFRDDLRKYLKRKVRQGVIKDINDALPYFKKWRDYGIIRVPYKHAPILSGTYYPQCSCNPYRKMLNKYWETLDNHNEALMKKTLEEGERERKAMIAKLMFNGCWQPVILVVSHLPAFFPTYRSSMMGYAIDAFCDEHGIKPEKHTISVAHRNMQYELVQQAEFFMICNNKIEVSEEYIGHFVAYKELHLPKVEEKVWWYHPLEYPKMQCFVSIDVYSREQDTEMDIKKAVDQVFKS